MTTGLLDRFPIIAKIIETGNDSWPDVWRAAFTFAGTINWPARQHCPGGKRQARAIARDMVEPLVSGIARASASKEY